MVKVIGISGSPRTGGNTEFLIKEALAEAKQIGVETEFISLIGKRIDPCDACNSCKKTKRCHIADDFEPIYMKMEEAEGIIIGSPVYFGSATPQVKALIDRAGYIQGRRGDRFRGKVGGPIVVARRAGQNFTFAQLLFFFFITEMIIPGASYWNIAFGREKGEAAQDKEGIETVRDFGRKVASLAKKLTD
jgi:multimeric flavodoxin WrbA